MNLKDIKTAIDSSLQENEELKATVANQRESVTIMQATIDKAAAKNTELENQVAGKDQVIDQLQQSIEAKETIIVQQQATISGLEKKLQEQTNTTPLELYFSVSKLTLPDFIARAQSLKAIAVIDQDISVSSTIKVTGDLTMISRNNAVITNLTTAYLFLLGTGDHVFAGFDINQTALNQGCFQTEKTGNMLWNNTFAEINVSGGSWFYNSERGGLYDAAKDQVISWCGTTIEDCEFRVDQNCIGLFSQDGPCKYLHMKNVIMYSNNSHNVYPHPNVSLRFDNVKSMLIGRSESSGGWGVAVHHYSGGGVPGKARYVELRNCSTNWTGKQEGSGGAWQIAEPVTGSVIVENCDFPPYAAPKPHMLASNSRFFDYGGGASVRGELNNCAGTIFPNDGTMINGGKFDLLNLSQAGTVIINNATIKTCFGGNNTINVTFNNCIIEAIANVGGADSKIFLKDSEIKSYMWQWKPAPGLINLL